MVLFKDIAKLSTDLLTKDFPHDKPWDVEAKSKGDNPQFINCASATASGVDANTSVKYSVKNVNSELKITANGGAMVDVNYSALKDIRGVTLGSRFERKISSKSSTPSDSVDLSCEYEKGRVHTRTQFNPLNTTFTTSGLVTCNKPNVIRIGGEVSGGVDMSALKYCVGASYTQMPGKNTKWTVGLKTHGDLEQGIDKVICNVHTSTQRLGEERPTELAVEVKHSMADGKTGLQFGGLWYMDNQYNTSIKAKIGHDAMMSVAVSHPISQTARGFLGVQVDPLKMSSPDSVKYGFKLSCKA